MWPVFLINNELPLHRQFAIDNVILAGLTIGEDKPNIDLFFNLIVIKLKILELGLNITIENVTRDTKFFCICCCCDKPAKAPLLNMQQYNNFSGCTKCLQKAESFKTSQLKLMGTVSKAAVENQSLNQSEIVGQKNKRDGTTRVYTYNED